MNESKTTESRPTRLDWPRIGDWTASYGLPFAIVVYLALRGGGYDEAIRSTAGVVIWAILLIGGLAGVLPRMRVSKGGWIAIGLLGAFVTWSLISTIWSESAERSFVETARVGSYLGVLVLAVAVQGQEGLRRTMIGLAAGIGLVSVLALLSRLHPAWFPTDEAAEAVPAIRGRLNYPLNYWNGLAALIAIGVPLVLCFAVEAKRVAGRILATAALPVMILALYFTFSRTGWLLLVGGLMVFFVFHPWRLAALPTLMLGAVGGAVAILLASGREALEDGLQTAVAHDQGDGLLVLVILICLGVAGLRLLLARVEDRGFLPTLPIARSTGLKVAGVGALIAIVVAIAAGGPGKLSQSWEDFKTPAIPEAGAERLSSIYGNGRYQYWGAAIDAAESAPVGGIGGGTYEFWWARNSTSATPGFINNAHSLYLEALGELGIVGLLLVLGLIAFVAVVGVRKAIAAPLAKRGLYAGALAAMAAFIAAMAADWGWDLVPIPAVFFLLAAALLQDREADEPTGIQGGESLTVQSRKRVGRPQALLIAVALPSLAVLAISAVGATLLANSQQAAREADLPAALDAAEQASRIQPWAAGPHLQQALVLELQGDLEAAREEALEATESEETNWRNWFILSRIEEELGDATAAADSYERARSLNPISPIFTQEAGAPPQ